MCRTEQVSARIVQEVTAEAVAVLKGEQELNPDTAVRLPSGRICRREVWDAGSEMYSGLVLNKGLFVFVRYYVLR